MGVATMGESRGRFGKKKTMGCGFSPIFLSYFLPRVRTSVIARFFPNLEYLRRPHVMWKSRIAVPAALTLAIALPVSALASGEEIEHLKRENAEMKQMLMRMQEQLQDVMMKTNAMEQQVRKAAEGAGKKGGMVKSKKEDITVSTTGGGINVRSSKGNEFKIGGRLMFDYDSYDDFWDSDDADDAEIRRSRITLSGKTGKNWSYKFTTDIDHEGEGASIDTGYLKYSSEPMYAMFGKHKRPGMLEERTSTKWISTIERSIINELSGAFLGKPDFGGISVGFATKGDMPMSGVIGVHDDQIDDPDDGDNIYGVGARFSIMPKFGDNSFLHAGASFYTVDYKGNTYRMRTRMGVHTTGHPFETDSHASDGIDQFGVELAYVNGPFSLQGEFMNVESDGTNNAACGASGTFTPTTDTDHYLEDSDGRRINPQTFYQTYQPGSAPHLDDDENGDDKGTIGVQTYLNSLKHGDTVREFTVVDPERAQYKDGHENTCDLEMDGFYLQAAYTLTGETRGYKADSGAFAAIKPKNEGGAWEVVARYEDAEVDIPGRSLSADLERMVLGVNWYVNKNVKFMLNYVDSEMDECSGGTRTFTNTADGGDDPVSEDTFGFSKCNNDDGDAISLRGQYVF
ncbi:MAG: porin [Gammaproteobacteria bacterium]|nr:porin [Gammaproteobacteria bacterium]